MEQGRAGLASDGLACHARIDAGDYASARACLSSYYTHVLYLEPITDYRAPVTAYIVGCLPGSQFLEQLRIKRMSKAGKSVGAVYMSVPLREGMPIDAFTQQLTKMPEREVAYLD